MTYAEFYTLVEGFLGVEADRKGTRTATKIRQEIEASIGETCQLVPYYRTGFRKVFNFDDTDVTDVGFASRIKLPQSIKVISLYHVRIGKRWALRPLYEYPWAHRSDLTAGMVTIGKARANMRYSLNPTGGRELLVYPRLTKGYGLMVEFSGVPFRSNGLALSSSDEVPFDNAFANVVALQVRIMVEADLNREPGAVAAAKARHMEARALLASEVNDRVDVPTTKSPADEICNPASPCVLDKSCDSYRISSGCMEIEMPQLEWVMFGDSGQRINIAKTKLVAAAVNAVNPDLIVHLGDASYGTHDRVGEPENGIQDMGETVSGERHALYDLFVRHYAGFIRDEKLMLTMGNHDLITDYGQPTLAVLPHVADLITSEKVDAKRLYYTFAKGPVRFIVLNTGKDDSDLDIQLPLQQQFIQDTIASSAESWIIVCVHRPAYSTEDGNHPGSTLVRSLLEDCKGLGVDLVVTGHTHAYERYMDPDGLLHVSCGTGGAILNPQKSGENLNAPGSLRYMTGIHGFLQCAADSSKLRVAFMDTNGNERDTFTLAKSD